MCIRDRIRSKDGSTWCSSSETDLYDPALEDELFGPAMALSLIHI